jgi:EAL domain-containing protein (putative c-di-GMP-specific phosphodiesterase class I)
VAAALHDADLDGSSLTIEVTESVLTADSGRIIGALDELRRTGVRVAIDDFGTGYSSLAALAELPIDILKIDKSFIDDITIDQTKFAVGKLIIDLAHTLGLRTVAEGVERPEQAAALRELRCHAAQGYLFSRPLPVARVDTLLSRWNSGIAATGNDLTASDVSPIAG